jgi:SAM-dependent methyltransferase
MPDWYEDDRFWERLAPLLLDDTRAGNASKQVDELVALLHLPDGARVLDLGCGPGRHSIELARRGFQVVGVDRTAVYLDAARSAAEGAGVSIEFIQDDMRAFRRPESFDAAINLLSSFGYFEETEDDRRVLDNVHASLVTGGRFVLDLAGKEVLARIYQERYWQEYADGTLLLEERHVRDDWRTLDGRWIFIKGTERAEHKTRIRVYSGAELAALLESAGFSSVALHGGLDGSPYDQTANRLVAAATR